MNPNHLLDREFFNITTRNNNNFKKEEKKVKIEMKQTNLIYMDRDEFSKKKYQNIQEKSLNKISNTIQEDNNKKIQNMQFNPYLTQYRNKKSVDRIGFNSNQKEELYYKPFERNIKVENKNLTKLDFIDKNKKTEYYKSIDLKKFNPNINYKDFLN